MRHKLIEAFLFVLLREESPVEIRPVGSLWKAILFV